MHRHAAGALAALVMSLTAWQVTHAQTVNKTNRDVDVVKTSAGDLRLMPLYHGSVMLQFRDQVIYVDPWSQGDLSGLPQADLIFITHTHLDHLDRAAIDKLRKPSTVLVASPAGTDTLNCSPQCGSIETIANGETKTVMGVEAESVAMYNLEHGPEPGKVFHHRGVGGGFVLGFGGTRVYFSGDTECVPEIKALKNVQVAFIAMNLPKTMSPLDAAACVKAFKPAIVYPYHYRGSNVGEFAAALKGLPIEVRVRKLEGEP